MAILRATRSSSSSFHPAARALRVAHETCGRPAGGDDARFLGWICFQQKYQILNFKILVGGLVAMFYFPINIGFLSSSQLTNSYIFQRGSNHQPPTSSFLLCCWRGSSPPSNFLVDATCGPQIVFKVSYHHRDDEMDRREPRGCRSRCEEWMGCRSLYYGMLKMKRGSWCFIPHYSTL